jgi:hypothetical protein
MHINVQCHVSHFEQEWHLKEEVIVDFASEKIQSGLWKWKSQDIYFTRLHSIILVTYMAWWHLGLKKSVILAPTHITRKPDRELTSYSNIGIITFLLSMDGELCLIGHCNLCVSSLSVYRIYLAFGHVDVVLVSVPCDLYNSMHVST